MAEPLLHLELPASEKAPRMARDAVAALDGALGDVREDTLLLVSELVTNSVLHTDVDADAPVALTVQVADDRIRVEVSDPGSGFAPDADAAEGGWGLRLVEMLSMRWGVEPQGGGSLVWFEMARGATPRFAFARPR